VADHKHCLHCPRCTSERVHRSRPHDLMEKSFKMAGARKRRCHECGFDYFELGSSVVVKKDLERLARRLLRYLAAAVSLAILLSAIHWFVLRTADPGPSGNCPKSKDLAVFADG